MFEMKISKYMKTKYVIKFQRRLLSFETDDID